MSGAAPAMSLVSSGSAAKTFHLQTVGPGWTSWALCTVNDATGELLITSDWGNWAHRWDVRHIGSVQSKHVATVDGDPGDEHRTPVRRITLTEFIGDRRAVDYLADKLQGRDGGRRFSADKTVAAWRRTLCERRLEVGRREIETGRRAHLTRDLAREIWDELGEAADDIGDHADLFLARVYEIDGFTDRVDGEPYDSLQYEQTAEDRALRESILPALVKACAGRR